MGRRLCEGGVGQFRPTRKDVKMTDTTTTEKVDRVAKHELIATKGGEHLTIETAAGIRYTDRASGSVFEQIIPLPAKAVQAGLTHQDFIGTPIMMFALFGAKTKATNETSRVRNGKDGDTTQQMEALDEVFSSICDDGVWREKAAGGGGSRTDKALLAQVFVEMLGSAAKGDAAYYAAKFESDLPYMRKVLASEAGNEYRKRVGKAPVSAASLA